MKIIFPILLSAQSQAIIGVLNMLGVELLCCLCSVREIVYDAKMARTKDLKIPKIFS